MQATEHSEQAQPLGLAVDRGFRPIGYLHGEDFIPHGPNGWTGGIPVYDQAALDAAAAAAIERCAALLDAEADRQEAAWEAHLASGRGGPAFSLHAIPRGYASMIRKAQRSQ